MASGKSCASSATRWWTRCSRKCRWRAVGHVPAESRPRISGSAPRQPTPAADVYEEFKRDVLPYPTGNIHPRFWGWVIGTGTPLAMLADMLASGMNPQVAEFDD